MDRRASTHDIVVIGASAGGFEPLRLLVAELPADFPAAVFVVMHIGATSHLVDILSKVTILPVRLAKSGDPVERGTISIAGPGAHLLLHDGHILVRRGPRENMARPAIDPLFRSAAATFGGRVIGVVLSGALSDGSAGLRAIKRCGGLAVAQDPADAAVSDMPASAIGSAEIDHVVTASAMAPLLSRLVLEPAGATPEIPYDIRLESAIAAQQPTDMATESMLGIQSPFTCPDCNGALWELDDPDILRYRCHVGHAFSAEAVMAGRAAEVDRLSESLLRSHRERAALSRRMAEAERARHRHAMADRLDARAREYDSDANMLRDLFGDRDNTGEAALDRDERNTHRDAKNPA